MCGSVQSGLIVGSSPSSKCETLPGLSLGFKTCLELWTVFKDQSLQWPGLVTGLDDLPRQLQGHSSLFFLNSRGHCKAARASVSSSVVKQTQLLIFTQPLIGRSVSSVHWFIGQLVISIVGCSVGFLVRRLAIHWLVGWSVCWWIHSLISWLVNPLVGWLVGQFVGWLVCWMVGQFVGGFIVWLVGWWIRCLVGWFVGHFVDRLVSRSNSWLVNLLFD